MMVRMLALAATLLLGACSAGTEMQMSGEVCGSPVDLTITDRKDRSAFEAHVACPQGGSVTITSSESSTSQVIAEQTKLLGEVSGLLSKLAEGAASGMVP